MSEQFDTVIKVGMDSSTMEASASKINSKIKVLDSSFKAVQTQAKTFGESTTTLSQKQQILSQKVSIQNSKIKQLKDQYEKSAKETGENSRATERLATRYNRAVEQLTRMQGQLRDTNRRLGDQKTKFQEVGEKINKFGDKAKQAGKYFAIATGAIMAMGAAALKLALDIGNVADRLLDLNSITGHSTDEIQRWQYACVEAGTNLEAVTDASLKFTQSLNSMDSESNKSREALKKLHLSFRKIKDMDADERMNVLVEALQGVGDKTERARLGADLFGKKWQDLAPILDLGVEGLKKAKANANVFSEKELNDANEFRIAFDKLKYSFGQLGLVIGGKLAPALKDVIDKMNDQMPEVSEKVANAIVKLLPIISTLVGIFIVLVENLDIVVPALIAVGAIFTTLKIASLVTSITSSFSMMNPVMLKTTGIILAVVAGLTALAAIIAVIMGRDLGSAFDDIGRGVQRISQPNVPHYATGTTNHRGGLAIINEEGGEIVDLPNGSRVIPHDISKEMARNSGSGGNIYNITIDAKKVKEYNDMIEMANDIERKSRKR